MKPHKHADLIKAWADGAQIQHQGGDGNWYDSPSYPPQMIWYDGTNYRIKPKPEFVPVLHIDCLLSMAREMEYAFQNESNLEGRVWASRLIKYIREGETGELKSAEVLNERK